MRSLKKLITVMLAFAMMLTCVGIPAMADFSDITDQRVQDAVNKLVAYGIITGYDDNGDGVAESFKPDNQITRAEFAAIVTRMKGVADNLASDAVTGFADLDNDSSRAWARPYVKAAVDLKIINGFEDGTFRAGEPVTYEQAVKMLVCAVGYEVVAQSEYNKALVSNPNITWSQGYITAATKHGITTGVMTAQITQPASRGVVGVLTSNALEVPPLVTDENGNLVKPEDGKEETENNMKTITGVVTGTFYTGVDDDETGLLENEIIIDATDNDDDGEYRLSNELADSIDLDAYIGRRVDAYYDNLDGVITSISIKSSSSKTIDEAAIESVSGYSIKYTNSNGKTSTEDLSSYAFIVNGKYVDSYDLDTFKNGTIEYFQNGSYRIAKVSSYDIFVVSSFNKEDEKIFLKYAKYNGNNYYQFPVRNSDKPEIFVKSSGGSTYNKTAFDSLSLSAFDVINYLESPAGTAGDPIRRMYVTKGAKSGKVTAKLEGEREVELNDETFYLTQQYYSFEGDSNDQKAPFDLSDNCTYYLDYTGQIAAVKYTATDSTSWYYGYIYDVDTREDQIGIFTSGGEKVVYTLKDSVKVDGEKTKAGDVFGILDDAAAEIQGNELDGVTDATYAQPIKYSTSGGKIDAIDTILNADGEISKYNDTDTLNGSNDSFTYDGVTDGDAGSTSTTKVTVDGTSYGINSATIIIYAPDDRSDIASYAVMNNSSAFSVTADRYTEVFGMDSTTNRAKIVVVYKTNPTLVFTGSSPYMIVSKVGYKDDIPQFTGYIKGAKDVNATPIVVSEDNYEAGISNVDGDDIKEGDIIRYITDNKGEIVAIQRIYEAGASTLINGDEDVSSISITTSADFVAKFGTVEDKDSTDNTLTIKYDGDKTATYKVGSTTFLKLASNGKEVNSSDVGEAYTDGEADAASTIITITNSTSSGATAKVVYIVK